MKHKTGLGVTIFYKPWDHGVKIGPPLQNHRTMGPENHGTTYFFIKNHGTMVPWFPWKPWDHFFTASEATCANNVANMKVPINARSFLYEIYMLGDRGKNTPGAVGDV